MEKTAFFNKDKKFYTMYLSMFIVVAAQNFVAYSVNMADNIMLGRYGQTALSGAATVNQIFFIVQQFAISVGNGLVSLIAQYWGKKDTDSMRTITGKAFFLSLGLGLFVTALCSVMPRRLLGIFTSSDAIIEEGLLYLAIIKWTFPLYMVSQLFIAALRSVKTVKISFGISCMSLVVNVIINYTLIFGNFGFPEMGVRGAAIGTIIARILELIVVLVYVWKADKKIRLFAPGFFKMNRQLTKDFFRVTVPFILSGFLWAISVPFQTAILGHLSDDAIAANSMASTFYQYFKVILSAASATSSVVIGQTIGKGMMGQIKQNARSLSFVDIVLGLVMGLALLILKNPLLSLYNLTDNALLMADHIIIIYSLIMFTMSYQMCTGVGIMQSSGDVKYYMILNLVSIWFEMIPLSFMAAFWWKWPVEAVVLCLQSDQILKCIPVFFRFRTYKWIHVLTHDTPDGLDKPRESTDISK